MGWQHFELAPPGSSLTIGKIARTSRIHESMEVFYVGANGSVQDAFWYDNANWQHFELAPPGSASTSGGITAVSRIPGSMELWYVGANGSVQDAFWYQDPPDVVSPQLGQDTATFTQNNLPSGHPLGADYVKLVLNRNGDITFTGHVHDSGFFNITYGVVAVVMTPQGTAYTILRSGHVEGTEAGLPFGTPNRNDDFTVTGNNPQIAANWDQVRQAKMHAILDGTPSFDLGSFIGDGINKAISALVSAGAAAGAAAIIALL
jgi:hypothetical protein